MKKVLSYIGLFVAVIVIAFLILFSNGDIGTYKSNIEKDSRVSQKISDDWQVVKQTTKTMSAMIYYDDEMLSNHTYSIYVNRNGLSLGYFFRSGGIIAATMESIAEFYLDGYNERAYISMNKQQVSEVEIDNGETLKQSRLTVQSHLHLFYLLM